MSTDDTKVELVRAKLAADVNVVALVGDRIHPQVAPQDEPPPFVVLTVIDESPWNTLTSTDEDTGDTTRLQVDCYATTYVQARAVARAAGRVIGNLSGPDLSATRAGGRDLYDDERQLRRVSLDFMILP